jgi:hypothetical protein
MENDVRPHTVIVVASFNDLLAKSGSSCRESYARRDRKKSKPQRPSTAWQSIYPQLRDVLIGNSQLFVLLARRLNQVLVKWGFRASFVSTMYYYDTEALGDSRAAVARTALASLENLISRTGARAVFVYLPGYLEVNDKLWNLASVTYSGNTDCSLPHDQLLASAKTAGFIHIIDLQANGSGSCTNQKMYYPLDMHLNASGTACVAKILTQKLIELSVSERN